MKSIILLLIGITLVAAQRPPGQVQKDLATDFLIDNILNPLLQGIQTNGINYLLSSLLGLFGKRDLATDFLIDNILNPLLQGIQQNGLNYLLSSLLGLFGKRDLSIASIQQFVEQALQTLASFIQNLINLLPRDLATDFLIDNILNPLLQGIQTNGINYLLGSLLSLFGK